MESAPTQRMSALVEKMLGDSTRGCARKSKRWHAAPSARSRRRYSESTGTTRRCFRTPGDARTHSARSSAEHRRRAEEERDRHAVRAVVHPVQLTEWEMIAERATWKLNTRTGHEAYFTARPLAGAAVWVFGCETCGTSSPRGGSTSVSVTMSRATPVLPRLRSLRASTTVVSTASPDATSMASRPATNTPGCAQSAAARTVRFTKAPAQTAATLPVQAALDRAPSAVASCATLTPLGEPLRTRRKARAGSARRARSPCEGGVAETSLALMKSRTARAASVSFVSAIDSIPAPLTERCIVRGTCGEPIDRAGSSVSTIGWRARTKRTPFSARDEVARVCHVRTHQLL